MNVTKTKHGIDFEVNFNMIWTSLLIYFALNTCDISLVIRFVILFRKGRYQRMTVLKARTGEDGEGKLDFRRAQGQKSCEDSGAD